jgi:hypothetical protein
MEIKKSIWNLVVDLLSYSNNELVIYTSVDGGNTIEEMRIILENEIIEGYFTIKDLIEHLRLNFKNPNIEVKIISDDRAYSINILGKKNGTCVFIHYPKDNDFYH